MRYVLDIAQAQGFGYIPSNVDVSKTPLDELIFNIITYALILVGVIALGFLVYGGFLYITSHGDENQIDQAKKIITYAVIGIVVIGIAAALVNFVIEPFVGGAR